jgi:large conductance mechanosensitive channel
MSFISEFKAFAMRGNVVDLAVGVIIGGAFGKIVNSVVSDILMPPLGWLIGGVNFKDLKILIKNKVEAAKDAAGNITSPEVPEVAIAYGNFIQTVVDFTIIAFCIFLMVKAMNALNKKQEAAAPPPAPPAPNPQEVLLTEIRDLLKEQRKS